MWKRSSNVLSHTLQLKCAVYCLEVWSTYVYYGTYLTSLWLKWFSPGPVEFSCEQPWAKKGTHLIKDKQLGYHLSKWQSSDGTLMSQWEILWQKNLSTNSLRKTQLRFIKIVWDLKVLTELNWGAILLCDYFAVLFLEIFRQCLWIERSNDVTISRL